MKVSIYLLLFLSIFSCQKQNKNIDKIAFNDIFQSTIDSTLIDRRIYLGFEYFPEQIDSIENAPSKRIVAINENLTGILEDDLKKIPKNYKSLKFSTWKIQPDKFSSSKYEFKKLSELPYNETFNNWSNKYKTYSGLLSFSRIYFDDKFKNGIFKVTYSCNANCEIGYLVYIALNKNKWQIKKVIKTYIS